MIATRRQRAEAIIAESQNALAILQNLTAKLTGYVEDLQKEMERQDDSGEQEPE